MDKLMTLLENFDYMNFLKVAGILLIGTMLTSAFGRFVFGKRSALNNAVSSAIGILFLYAVVVVLEATGSQYASFTAPLPLVTLTDTTLSFFDFRNAHYTVICSQLLSMVVLSFLMNITDRWLPQGKNIFTWVLFRGLTVFLALVLHCVVTALIGKFLPTELQNYAPAILLALLIIMLLTGALKVVVGALLTTVNPLIAALYTFFFANVIGKMVTKAILTTAILSGLVMLLHQFGCSAIAVSVSALTGYIPFALVLVILWYFVIKIF